MKTVPDCKNTSLCTWRLCLTVKYEPYLSIKKVLTDKRQDFFKNSTVALPLLQRRGNNQGDNSDELQQNIEGGAGGVF